MSKTVHRAVYILAEPNLLLQNASVHVSNSGRISRVDARHGSPDLRAAEVVDWGAAIILPGLVNAHAHLELTAFHNQLTQFSSFTDWILQLITRRKSWTAENFLSSAREGARLSLAAGTTLVGDVTSSGVGWHATRGENLRRVVFEEVISLAPGRSGQVLSQLKLLIKQCDPDPLLVHGVSPHAPYSVSPELYRGAANLARSEGMLLATHVAETREELQFLQDGTGGFADLLETIGALPANWIPPKALPIPYLDSLGVLRRSSLLIHCNYLDRESIVRIRNAHGSVVYCPRSHDFFGHEEHPVRQLLDIGVNVALGTDSLASNFSLSMIDEMRYLYKRRKDIKAEEIFSAATVNGAAALNSGGTLGRLRRGYWADMTVLELPPNLRPQQLLGAILEGAGECIATVVQGQIVWQKSQAN